MLQPIRLRKNRLRYLKQSVFLTGFDTSTFRAAITNLSSIYAIFSRCVPTTKLQPWSTDEYEGNQTISASNRLFTPRTEGTSETAAELGSDVDPDGRLLQLAGTEFFHSDDNKVHYWEKVEQRQGGHR
jgi:hypothetical protein